MATTNELPAIDVNSYDYIVVGGGTAGCVIAARLAQYLPNKRTLVIEGGPSDFMDDRVLNLKDWLSLLGGELDYDYGTVEQPNGISSWIVGNFSKLTARRQQSYSSLSRQGPGGLL
jgi:choline dehydrogenase-like flavoprotein